MCQSLRASPARVSQYVRPQSTRVWLSWSGVGRLVRSWFRSVLTAEVRNQTCLLHFDVALSNDQYAAYSISKSWTGKLARTLVAKRRHRSTRGRWQCTLISNVCRLLHKFNHASQDRAHDLKNTAPFRSCPRWRPGALTASL